MSMLTPPGMGGQYRITGDKYPRMRRPRRRGRLVLAAVASVTALGLLGWGTLQLVDLFTGGGDQASAAGSKAECAKKAAPAAASPSPAALPKPGVITVNVFNATPVSGLAKKTADELKKRGFKIGDVGNATKEYDKKVKGAGILLGPSASLDTSLPVVGARVSGAERRTDAGRKGAEVDLILGTSFKKLASEAEAEKALGVLVSARAAAAGAKKGC
ncbi:LytR C-terminal domain-containing protein [Streptomyces sp. NPDC048002]|uniref:LytR C-terminal domain-containing protein n=1 Tax=Streptomyces sp. NPDC048002 TaxID=3154344 RepID=UPI0033CB20F7